MSSYYRRKIGICPSSVSFQKISELKGASHISIGENSGFGPGLFLTAWNKWVLKKGEQSFSPKISIGSNCRFGAYNHITAINEIRIGDNLLTGKWVTITDNSHGSSDFASLNVPPVERPLISKGTVVIGNNVWIGEKVTILPGVTIGNGVVIGANSVVTKSVPDYCVVAGNPAKIIKQFKS